MSCNCVSGSGLAQSSIASKPSQNSVKLRLCISASVIDRPARPSVQCSKMRFSGRCDNSALSRSLDFNLPQAKSNLNSITQSATPVRMKGLATAYPNVRIKRAKTLAFNLWLDQRRIPAPEVVVGQVGAAPPAVDRVVAAEVILARHKRFAKTRE